MENTIKVGQRFWESSAKEFKNNDIVVFNYYGDYDYTVSPPLKKWHRRFYRLVASSGDKLEIRNGDLYVNSTLAPLPSKAKIEYEVRVKGTLDPDEAYWDKDNTYLRQLEDSAVYVMYMSTDVLEELRQKSPSVVIQPRIMARVEGDAFLAKPSADVNWSLDFYGPLKIPSPGEKIVVDAGNYKLYENIPGIQMGENTIQEKLYFVLGDYRHGAADSRFIGFIPHSNMIGIVKIE